MICKPFSIIFTRIFHVIVQFRMLVIFSLYNSISLFLLVLYCIFPTFFANFIFSHQTFLKKFLFSKIFLMIVNATFFNIYLHSIIQISQMLVYKYIRTANFRTPFIFAHLISVHQTCGSLSYLRFLVYI